MTNSFKVMSVIGRTTCRANHGECVPANVHRLDSDLELCVCRACGQGWVRDVDIWVKLDETMQRLKITTTHVNWRAPSLLRF